jgi:hypothetical protein
MSRRALILVEGQTEERFVKDMLAPAFFEKELFFSATILVTKRVKDGPNFKGGVTSFAKFRNDLQRLLGGARDALVTTMLDYYGLPVDFPGMATRPAGATTAEQRVEHVEEAMRQDFGAPPNFIPFLALHEFEAWLFASATELPLVIAENHKQPQFAAIRASVATPEEINDRPEFAPSKRIQMLFPGYRKTLHGPTAAVRIGLDRIRGECPHFHQWMSKLEAFAAC